MERTVHISIVAPRYKCASALRRMARDKDYGLIAEVKLMRIGLLTWCLTFDIEVKIK